MPRNNILLQILPQPRRVQLPDGRGFFAKYQRVGRHALNSTRLRINGTYKQKISLRRQRICRYKQTNTCRQRQQAGASIDLSTVIELGKKVDGSSVGKMIIIDVINALPTAYRTLKAK